MTDLTKLTAEELRVLYHTSHPEYPISSGCSRSRYLFWPEYLGMSEQGSHMYDAHHPHGLDLVRLYIRIDPTDGKPRLEENETYFWLPRAEDNSSEAILARWRAEREAREARLSKYYNIDYSFDRDTYVSVSIGVATILGLMWLAWRNWP